MIARDALDLLQSERSRLNKLYRKSLCFADFERSSLEMLSLEKSQLARIDAAIGRISNGTYGQCAICGKDIPEAELQATPERETCLVCTRRAESVRAHRRRPR